MSHKLQYIILGTMLCCMVACSTTRKSALKEETLTQISEVRADTGSLYSQTVSNDSIRKESWQELVIEWEKPAQTLPEGASDGDTVTTGLGKILRDIRNSGATRVTLKKGQAMTEVHTEVDSTKVESQCHWAKDTDTQKKVQSEETKTQRPGWMFVVFYIIFMIVVLVGAKAVSIVINKLK